MKSHLARVQELCPLRRGQTTTHVKTSRCQNILCSFAFLITCFNYSSRPKSKVAKRVGAPKVRKSLQPGTILVLVAGVHRGKRVVLLKALKSGLLLVTGKLELFFLIVVASLHSESLGPYKVNRVPLRRIHQHYVIATSTRLNIENVKVPDNVDDKYFRRVRQRRLKKAEGDVFAKKKKVLILNCAMCDKPFAQSALLTGLQGICHPKGRSNHG